MRWLHGFGRPAKPSIRFFRIWLAVLFVLLALYYAAPRKQAFTVFASTEYLVVETVSSDSPDWELPQMEVCLRTDTPGQSSTDIAACDNALFEQHVLSDVALRWSGGYRLVLQGFDPSGLVVLVERDPSAEDVVVDGFKVQDQQSDEDAPFGVAVTNGSLLRIPFLSGDRPMIPLRGKVSIGDVPSSRHGLLLREARFEIRQTLGLTRRPVVVAEGTLFPGDRIGFARAKQPLWDRFASLFRPAPSEQAAPSEDITASLFVTDISRLSPAFDLVATTSSEFSSLRLTRIGSQPTIIPVSWTQRVAADTIPVALATLLGLLGTAIALSNA